MRDDGSTLDLAHGVPPIAVSTGSTLANRTGSWKYIQPIYQDKVAPCNAACPAGIDVEGCMDLLREEKLDEARDLLLRENPLPGVTGRICEHPCQASCSRARFDEAVNIHAIERMLGDVDPVAVADTPVRSHLQRAAVVGSGPAGLSCAYHLARLGYAVSVLEADAEPGGWLRYGVPEYRLPRAVLVREIERIRAAGVEIHCGVRVGGNLSWKELERYDAVFVATGARHREAMEWERHDLPDVRPGIDFLHEVQAGAAVKLPRRVVVVGGTDTAVDCARSAVRLGAEVLVLTQGAREHLQASPDAVADAIAEGVRFEFLARPVGLQTTEHADDEPAIDAIRDSYDGDAGRSHPRLVGVACVRMQPVEPGASGARWLVSVAGSAFVVPAELLLLALGAEPALGFLPADVHRKGYVIAADAFGRTSRDGVFAGGDVAGGPRTVADAIGAGKRAAIGVDHFLRTRAGEKLPAIGEPGLRWGGTGSVSMTRWRGDDPVFRTNELNEVVPFDALNLAYFTHTPAAPDRHRTFDDGTTFAEANLGLARDAALAEAGRCFNCGVCNMCEQCLIFCPDVAIKRHQSGHGFSLSYKYCKGCGVCVEECPRGAMTMTREGL